MHPVHIGICRDNHLIIPQTFQAILNIQGRLKQVKLLVLVNDLLCQAITIQRLTPQTKYSLVIRVTALRDRTASRVTLRDKDTAFL